MKENIYSLQTNNLNMHTLKLIDMFLCKNVLPLGKSAKAKVTTQSLYLVKLHSS